MAKRMLVDATQPEETRVVVVNGNRLEDLDFEIASRKQLKGNIYLAKVTRVEPSLQAAFIEYGGNRHGFLAFSEIHPDYYRIPVADREALLAEERRLAELADEEEDEAPRRRRRGRDRAEPSPTHDSEAAEDSDANGEDADAAEPAPVVADVNVDVDVAQEIDVDSADPAPEGSARGGQSDEDDGPGKVMAASIPVESVAEEPGDGTSVPGDDGSAPLAEGEAEGADPASLVGGLDPSDGAYQTLEAEPVRLDTVGGDEADDEDMVRRRPRPLRSYKIQEVIKRRQILLVQVTKEERGTKGAALTTYLSLPGRYCVLMPNTGRGGGVSRKITNPQDRKRLKEMLSDLDIPQGMAVILRTAGLERSKAEIKRDLEYLLRLWDSIREQTLQSTAPELIYEEANLIKRSIRDLYTNDIDEVLVEGEEGYRVAKDFMRMLVPSQTKRVQPYRDETIPLFFRYQVESQIDAIHSPVVQLKSGGYIVINQTEALVAIDVNSGRSTRERNIEETAFKTNLEAADEVARQLRLRDLAGLIVIDFIDMEDNRNNAAVERRLKEAMKSDRARIQLGRISPFGLLELSRQRLRPSLLEANFEKCPHCTGLGVIRSIESAALHTLRAIEEEGIRRRSSEITVAVASRVGMYILNAKRNELALIEQRYGLRVFIQTDDTLIVPESRIERVKARLPGEEAAAAVATASALAEPDRRTPVIEDEEEETEEAAAAPEPRPATESRTAERPGDGERAGGRRGRRGRRRQGGERPGDGAAARPLAPPVEAGEETGEEGDAAETTPAPAAPSGAEGGDGQPRKRRRGKRGGRRRGRNRFDQNGGEAAGQEAAQAGEEGFADFDGETDSEIDGEDETAADEAPPSRPVAPPLPAAGDEVVDFDWQLDDERPVAEAAIPLTPAAEDAEPVVASTEGDSVAVAEVVVAESVPSEAPARKRPSRRRAPAGAEAAEPAAETALPPKRPSRRRGKAVASEDAVSPADVAAAEVAPEAAAEIMPIPAPDGDIAPVGDPGPGYDDSAAIAPTEHPDILPPPPAVIVADAPLPAPTRDATADPEIPTEPPGPPKRGWWRK